MKKRHFTGKGKQKIHTARHGTCSAGSKGGGCNYRNNVEEDATVLEPRFAHHILPVTTTIAYQGDGAYQAARKAIDAVYRKTKWCVNAKANLKWLPNKTTYMKPGNNLLGGKPLDWGEAPVWSMDRPCHDWDHLSKNGYNDEVVTAFKAEIWDAIAGAADAGACPDDLEVVAEIEALVARFESALLARGLRRGGTKSAVLKMRERKSHWWLPFSMARTPVAMAHTVRTFGDRVKVPKLARRST